MLSRQKALTHVNGIVAQFSTQETDETRIDFTKGSFQMEWSENLYCSLDGQGTGMYVSHKKRMEQGKWRDLTSESKTSGDSTVSCSREDKEAVFRKSGKVTGTDASGTRHRVLRLRQQRLECRKNVQAAPLGRTLRELHGTTGSRCKAGLPTEIALDISP